MTSFKACQIIAFFRVSFSHLCHEWWSFTLFANSKFLYVFSLFANKCLLKNGFGSTLGVALSFTKVWGD